MIWVGTRQGGLNRLDPDTQTFTHYRYRPDDGNSLAGDNISSLALDQSGNLWIGANGQLNRFDPATETFARHPLAPCGGNTIRKILASTSGVLWVAGSGLSKFDPRTGEFVSWTLPTEQAGTETPYALNVDRRTDTVWICGTQSDSLIRFTPADEQFTVYPLPNRVTYTREIDFDEERFFATVRRGYWKAPEGTPSRTVAEVLVQKLEF